MSKLHHIAIAFVAVILLAGATASSAQTYTLTIKDGQVYVNGKKLSEDDIPATLDPHAVDVNLSFSGTPSPRFEMDGRFYVIDGAKLREVENEEDSDNKTTVIFRDSPAESNVARGGNAGESRARAAAPAYKKNVPIDSDPNVVMQQYVFELSQNTKQLNEMGASLSQRQAQDLIREVHTQAELASQYAQELPYLELQNYFSSVRNSDELLYQRLVSELELERETQRLAAEVRQLPSGDERAFKVRELRELLASILELKQENRQMEINQLEKQLAILKQRFADREVKKDRLIERRIKELVGSPR